MDVLAPREVGSYRGAAAICGTTHKPARRIVEAHEAVSTGGARPPRVERGHNYDAVVELSRRRSPIPTRQDLGQAAAAFQPHALLGSIPITAERVLRWLSRSNDRIGPMTGCTSCVSHGRKEFRCRVPKDAPPPASRRHAGVRRRASPFAPQTSVDRVWRRRRSPIRLAG